MRSVSLGQRGAAAVEHRSRGETVTRFTALRRPVRTAIAALVSEGPSQPCSQASGPGPIPLSERRAVTRAGERHERVSLESGARLGGGGAWMADRQICARGHVARDLSRAIDGGVARGARGPQAGCDGDRGRGRAADRRRGAQARARRRRCGRARQCTEGHVLGDMLLQASSVLRATCPGGHAERVYCFLRVNQARMPANRPTMARTMNLPPLARMANRPALAAILPAIRPPMP